MNTNIESHLIENRVFKPKRDFSKKAYITSLAEYQELYRESIESPKKFWARQTSETLRWQKKWKTVLEWKLPFAKWFVGGKLNVSENCIDRHLTGVPRNKAALIWEGEPGEKVTLTYQQLHREVCKFANVLKRNEQKGRPRHHLHAHVSGGRDRDAGVRENRRDAFSRFRWVQRGIDQRPDQG